MNSPIRVDCQTVAISSLREHPANPRRGDIPAIAESLTAHGQYRPIVVQRSTKYVIAGNHTLKAAKSLGWKKIAVTWLDVDDETAARVLVADNRTSDLASYDDGRLAELLRSVPDLDGTGFDKHDLDRLEGVFDRPLSLSNEPSGAEPGASKRADLPQVRIGEFWLRVEPAAWEAWATGFADGRKKKQVTDDLRVRLGLVATATTPRPAGPERPADGAETARIADLQPFPVNGRQGDVGAICESLAALGQYRPIVVNRRDRTILVGNHTWQAARMLGWETIAVNWVDVDEVQAAKIVAVDNRTSDLATYDDDSLLTLLTSMPSLDGTGFSSADLDDLLNLARDGAPSRRPAASSKVLCVIGEWGWKSARDDWSRWRDSLAPEIGDGLIHAWLAHALTLPDNVWTPEEP